MAHKGHTASVAIHRIELPTPFAVGTVNSFLITCEDQRVLVDCGPLYSPTQAAMTDGLAELGLRTRDITGVVLTHGHADHVGMTSMFQTQGAPVYSHPRVSTWLEPGGEWDQYRMDFFSRLYQEMGLPEGDAKMALDEFLSYRVWNDRSVVDVPLVHGAVLPPLPMFRVVDVPGHAQAAIALWNEQTGQLIGGDQLLPHISSNALIEPQMDASSGRCAGRTQSLIDYRRNLQELRKLNIQTVFPGHGETFGDVNELIDKRLDDQLRRRQKFLQLLSKIEPCTAYDLALSFFPAAYRNQASLILSETLGFLDWAESDGFVRSERDDTCTIRWKTV